ncbi:MAG: antibiotic biosynthesis monooxygenase family protein [Candidatus Sumerlaeaceae bacterium]
MITVGMNYQVLPDKNELFERVFNSVLGVMAELEGHASTHLYRDVFEPQSYLIVSEWSSREAFDAFISSPRFRSVTDFGKEQVLAGRPSHHIYER